MTIAVVTHFNPNNKSKWFDEAIASVEKYLPNNATHHLIEARSVEELEELRWAALKLAPFVCFVDDDDLVLDDSISKCFKALTDRPEVAVAFTDELYINEDGMEIPSVHAADRNVSYFAAAQSPQSIHHLVMLRTDRVDWRAKTLNGTIGRGCDWLIKASTAIAGGAIHLPFKGYAWRHRAGQVSKNADWNVSYTSKMGLIRAYLGSQIIKNDIIPKSIF